MLGICEGCFEAPAIGLGPNLEDGRRGYCGDCLAKIELGADALGDIEAENHRSGWHSPEMEGPSFLCPLCHA